MKINKKLAFTLSEILITIVIIAVVASLTIFFLSPQIEKAKNVAILKVAYAKLGTLVKDFAGYSGCNGDFASCFPGDGEFALEFSRYLVNQRGFMDTKSHTDFYGSFSNFASQVYYMNPTSITSVKLPKSVIAPGGAYKYTINLNMYDNWYRIGNDMFRAMVLIHVNNKKFAYDSSGGFNWTDDSRKRNILGKYVFTSFIMNSQTVIPGGSRKCANSNGWTYYCTYWKDDKNCSPKEKETATGNSCLGRIIDEGWKITYY